MSFDPAHWQQPDPFGPSLFLLCPKCGEMEEVAATRHAIGCYRCLRWFVHNSPMRSVVMGDITLKYKDRILERWKAKEDPGYRPFSIEELIEEDAIDVMSVVLDLETGHQHSHIP